MLRFRAVGAPARRKTEEEVIQGQPFAEREQRLGALRVGETGRRGAVGAFVRTKPRVQVSSEDAGSWWQLRQERLHLPRSCAVAREPPLPPTRPVLEVNVGEEDVHPADVHRRHRRNPALALAGQFDRARVSQRQRRQDRVSALDPVHPAGRREIPMQIAGTRSMRRLLQQEDDISRQGTAGEATGSKICEECADVARVAVQVPGDDSEIDGARRGRRCTGRPMAARGAGERDDARGNRQATAVRASWPSAAADLRSAVAV